jgi:hypothetical protein
LPVLRSADRASIPSLIPQFRFRGLYFTTLYHKGETTYGRDWPLYDSPGTGWFVGVVQSMQYEHYCEGNEHFYIDGAISPQINGTGSEDYYLGCFWPNRQYSSPFASCAGPSVWNARQEFGRKKFAILDTDSHHGNGTQDIYIDDKTVVNLSFIKMDEHFTRGQAASKLSAEKTPQDIL